MRLKGNMMTKRRIGNLKRLLARNSIKQVAALTKESYTTIYRVHAGLYDTGKLVKPVKEKSTRGMFNVEAEQDWILGGRISKRDRAA